MAKKKPDKKTLAAFNVGQQQATAILSVRSKALTRRAKALRGHAKVLASRSKVLGLPKVTPASVQSVGVLVAEGDSWFDYPLHDILEMLEDDHGYDIESVAHKGDPIEEMAYGGNQLEEFTRRIEKLLRRNVVPKAILLSGGGNDVAGDAFGMLLNHAKSSIAGFNAEVVAGVIDERIKTAYVTILSAVTRICEEKLGKALPILVHGYDYAVPDGRGFLGGWWLLPGPWLDPGFRMKGYEDPQKKSDLMKVLIDRLNTMVAAVAGLPMFPHVRYVDLRNTLPNGKDYRTWWANELHPTKKGFTLVTNRFAAELQLL